MNRAELIVVLAEKSGLCKQKAKKVLGSYSHLYNHPNQSHLTITDLLTGFNTHPTPSQEGSQVQPVAINKHSYLPNLEPNLTSDYINGTIYLFLILNN